MVSASAAFVDLQSMRPRRGCLSNRDHSKSAGLRARCQFLPRERKVMRLVVKGLLNKQMVEELGSSEITLKIQRGNAMRKIEASSLADLVRMAEKLGSDG